MAVKAGQGRKCLGLRLYESGSIVGESDHRVGGSKSEKY